MKLLQPGTELQAHGSGKGQKIQSHQNCRGHKQTTHKPLYNTVCCNMVLDIKQFKDGSQKCIDYIEK